MRGFFEDVCLPVILLFIILAAIAQGVTSYSCYGVGKMYGAETMTASFECYINSPKGWMKQSDYEIARIMGKF